MMNFGGSVIIFWHGGGLLSYANHSSNRFGSGVNGNRIFEVYGCTPGCSLESSIQGGGRKQMNKSDTDLAGVNKCVLSLPLARVVGRTA
jgi:hypothetical protein